MVLNVVIWTLHLNFLAKLFTTSWLMYATHVYTCRVASFSVSRLLAMAALSGGRGQVTGRRARGSGTAPDPASAGAQASSSPPVPTAARPAPAPRRNPRRVMLGGCTIGHLVPARALPRGFGFVCPSLVFD